MEKEREIKHKRQYQHQPHEHQSESITLRLDSIILNKLQREAEQKDTSVNALVSHVVRRHIDWHSNAAKDWICYCKAGIAN